MKKTNNRYIDALANVNNLEPENYYCGYFSLNSFEEFIIKCKNPIVVTNLRTLLLIISQIRKDSNLLLAKVELFQLIDKGEYKKVIKDLKQYIYRVDFKNRIYNLCGLEIPIEIVDEPSNKCFVIIKDSDNIKSIMSNIFFSGY